MSNDLLYPLASRRFYWMTLKGFLVGCAFVWLMLAMMVAGFFQISRDPQGPPWPVVACFATLYPVAFLASLWCIGYLIEVYREGVRGPSQELPPARGFFPTLWDGFLAVVMSFLAMLPLALTILAGTVLAGGAVFAASGPLLRWDETLGGLATFLGAGGVILGYIIALTVLNICTTVFLPLLHVRFAATGRPLSYLNWLWPLSVLRQAGGAYLVTQLPILAYWALYTMTWFTTLGIGTLVMVPLLIPIMLNQAYRTGRFYSELQQNLASGRG